MHARLVFLRSRIGSSGPVTFFCGDGSRNHFYGHSLPSTDSSWAVVSYWRKAVHIILVNCLGLSKMISNDQELIQSDLTSCPQNQKGNN